MVDFRDDQLKKWLAEEYEREIDEMEKVLFPDGILPDDGETEEEAKEAYQRLVARLKADGVYEEENDSKEADDHKADTNKKMSIFLKKSIINWHVRQLWCLYVQQAYSPQE